MGSVFHWRVSYKIKNVLVCIAIFTLVIKAQNYIEQIHFQKYNLLRKKNFILRSYIIGLYRSNIKYVYFY